jgi:drug/metabolite transporter (DMT)-like permease
MPTQKQQVSPFIVLVIGIFAVSTGSIFIRLAQSEVSSLAVAAYRMVLASLLLAIPAIFRHGEELRQLSRRQLWAMAGAGAFLALHFASWITSLEYTSVASSVVMVNTVPLWVALASPLVLKEKISRLVWGGLILALVGGCVVAFSQSCQLGAQGLVCSGGGSGEPSLWGNFLALVGAFGAAGYILIGRRVRGTLSLVPYTFCVYGTAAVLLLVVAVASGSRLVGFSLQTYGWLLALAVIPQLIGHTSYNWALRYLSAAYVSISLLGEPIGATVLALLVLGEVPGFYEVLGGLLILVGILLASVDKSD